MIYDPSDTADLDRYVREHREMQERISIEHPDLPFITQHVMANDLLSFERTWGQWAAGKLDRWQDGLALIGSYYRIEYLYRLYEQGVIDANDLRSILPDEWPFADPDDTDVRYIRMWGAAWAANDGRYLRDGEALPRQSRLTIYRGQEPDAPLGVSWTLDHAIAEKFAKGAALRVSNMSGAVLTAEVDRRGVWAYLTGRRESELIIPPHRVVLL